MTSASNNLENVENSNSPLALHFEISKPKDLLVDLATVFAISLYLVNYRNV
jgi:hypothetical protein